MAVARFQRGGERAAAGGLYERIGAFLADQRLEPDPASYAFAHAILTQPDGALAQAVATLTDGGVRLTRRDIEALGVRVTPAVPGGAAGRTDGLVAATQMQVEGFADAVEHLRVETGTFGRDLAAGVDAIRRAAAPDMRGVDEVVRLSAVMVDRVRRAETRLERATCEAAELRAKLEEARDNARRDPLTDLPNRRAFEEAFAAHAAGSDPVYLAVCDVDHFKQVNDRFGHAVGDRVLKAIGTALRDACPGHFVARYGGEEFVVLFTGVGAAAAHAVLDGARLAVEDKRYRLRESDEGLGSITFSAGLTGSRGEDTARTLFQRADTLLYSAKSTGRNRIAMG